MLCQETTIKIPDGFEIIEHRNIVDLDIAGDILSTKKQYKYTSAERNGLFATLICHSIRCPYCGYESLACFNSQNKQRFKARVPKSVINEWTTHQMSLFEDEDKTLALNGICYPAAEYICPKCQNKLNKAQRNRTIKFCESKNKLEISCELLDLSELFLMTWFMSGKIHFDKTVRETLVFNFGNGHTYIKLQNSDDEILAISDITTDISRWHDGIIYSLFSKSKIFRRILKRFFVSKCGGTLPFSVCELSLDKYVLLTRFVGYDRSFYDAIPFADEKQKIDGSFKSVAKKLRYAKKIPEIYKESGLPKMKSIRKLIFTNPGLMFYSKEIRDLWEAFQNPDLVRSLLNCEKTYQILSDLHMYEGIYRFYEDYIRVKSGILLCRHLKSDISLVHSYAVFYSALNRVQKKREQAKWLKKDIFAELIESMVCYYTPMRNIGKAHSIPMHAVEEKIPNCVIDGFSFVWLRNMMEYKRAGDILINCLNTWKCWNNPVVVVYKKQTMLAAIEVEHTKIRQAQLAAHHEISENQDLFKAYNKWQERFKLEYQPYEFDWHDDFNEDDELRLPF